MYFSSLLIVFPKRERGECCLGLSSIVSHKFQRQRTIEVWGREVKFLSHQVQRDKHRRQHLVGCTKERYSNCLIFSDCPHHKSQPHYRINTWDVPPIIGPLTVARQRPIQVWDQSTFTGFRQYQVNIGARRSHACDPNLKLLEYRRLRMSDSEDS